MTNGGYFTGAGRDLGGGPRHAGSAADGSVIWYGYFHDVTTRKRMEEALRERVLTQQKRERQIRFLATTTHSRDFPTARSS